MHTVIFGRDSCPYCIRAKQIAEQLQGSQDDFSFKYVDMMQEGISKADLEKTVGHRVLTVPQIFVDQKHIGGCNEFEAFARQSLGL